MSEKKRVFFLSFFFLLTSSESKKFSSGEKRKLSSPFIHKPHSHPHSFSLCVSTRAHLRTLLNTIKRKKRKTQTKPTSSQSKRRKKWPTKNHHLTNQSRRRASLSRLPPQPSLRLPLPPRHSSAPTATEVPGAGLTRRLPRIPRPPPLLATEARTDVSTATPPIEQAPARLVSPHRLRLRRSSMALLLLPIT